MWNVVEYTRLQTLMVFLDLAVRTILLSIKDLLESCILIKCGSAVNFPCRHTF